MQKEVKQNQNSIQGPKNIKEVERQKPNQLGS